MKAGLTAALAAARFAVAAAIIAAVAYVLSWQILWGGMAGAEAPFHLQIINWVATAFPNLPWWFPWDGMGVSYREAYPLASHWLAVAASRAFATSLEGGAQALQFVLMPLTALGLYAFFDWRLKRPWAGIVAGVLFMINPLPWVEWTHFGLFASWVGMILFMPAVIGLDAFFFAWLDGDRGWRMRTGAVAFVGLTTLLGTVSPHLLAAPLLAAPAYALAIPRASAPRMWRWILVVVPALWIGVALLSMFWLGSELQYLSVARSHWAGAGIDFNINRLSPIPLSDVLSLRPLDPQDLGALYSFSPASLLPALLGVGAAFRSGRARIFLCVAVVAIALMTFRDLYRPFFVVPGFAEFAVVAHRPFLLLASVAVPALAAIGLVEVPREALDSLASRWKSVARSRSIAVPAVAVVMAALFVADLVVFGGRVQGGSQLAYGPGLAATGAPMLRDIWQDNTKASLAQQLFDPYLWRTPAIKCDLGCPAEHKALAALGATFPSPPQRLELNSNIAHLDMAFHLMTTGGITHSYNDQVLPSRELSSWLEDSMLQAPGTTVKAQLAEALGVDAVALSKQQAGRAADYQALGWSQVNDDPLAFVNPQPSGLAAQWPQGTSVLVVGGTQKSVPELYNSVFKRATSGMLPFESAWLVRGSSPYIDDYSQQELSRYSGVIMLGYRYHDQAAAWARVDGYVRGGGRLFVETGWQYVDPDWNAGPAPAALPVTSLRWGVLNPSAPVFVVGAPDPQFGSLTYQGGGWGASGAPSLRPGATELVRSGDTILAARWQLGRGRVVWSGMNLIAHDASSGSSDEDQFVASQLAWLYPTSGAQAAITPQWTGDGQATLQLNQSDQRTLVLFKESLFPGWSARLVTPGGSRPVRLDGSEMDFMLATLDSVPAGSKLVFSYGPTVFEEATWVLSVLWLIALALWLVKPGVYRGGLQRVGTAVGRAGRRVAGTWDEEG